ncbi:hypothetical protein DH2020_016162 [Rehmannia glutinosa]|uniref:Reverse transcriptase domain-containing protein n=1 Tax=Rehmannia glutinosa TaxID=99300 RepID=A0ABR0WYS3_REHGL
MGMTQRYIQEEEINDLKDHEWSVANPEVRARKDPREGPRFRSKKDHEWGRDQDRQRPTWFSRYTPLNVLRVHALMSIEGKNMLKWPKKMRSMLGRRDNGKYYHFHKYHGHDAEECFQLKDKIERLIQQGYLKIFVRIKGSEAEGKRHGKDARPMSPPRHKSRGMSKA